MYFKIVVLDVIFLCVYITIFFYPTFYKFVMSHICISVSVLMFMIDIKSLSLHISYGY